MNPPATRKYDVVFHPRWWRERAGVDMGEGFWNDPETRIAADMKMRAALYRLFGGHGLGTERPAPRPLVGTDLLASGWFASALLGCGVAFAADQPPQVLCRNLDDAGAASLEKPDFDASPVWQSLQRQLDYLQRAYGHVETHLNLMGVQNVAMDLRGEELFVDYYGEDSPADHLLEVCCDTLLEIGRRLRAYSARLSSGVTSIMALVAPEVYLTSNCSVEMISLRQYRERLLPHDRRLALAFPPFGVHHCGQTMEHVADGYAQLPHLRFVEAGAGSDLRQVADRLPGDVLINARYSPVALARQTPADIAAKVAEIRALVPGPRLSISCVGIDDSVPDDRVGAFLDACRRCLG